MAELKARCLQCEMATIAKGEREVMLVALVQQFVDMHFIETGHLDFQVPEGVGIVLPVIRKEYGKD